MTKILALLMICLATVAFADEPKKLTGFTFACDEAGTCAKTGEVTFVVNEGLTVDGAQLDAAAQFDLVEQTLAGEDVFDLRQ